MNVSIVSLEQETEKHRVLAHACERMYTKHSNESGGPISLEFVILANPEKLDTTWLPVAISALGLALILCLCLLQSRNICKPFNSCHTGTKWITYACWSFLNGWADAITYRRYSGFATMMVGNMLLFGQSLVQFLVCGDDPRFVFPAPVFYSSMLILFMVGAALYRCAANRGFTGKCLAPICLAIFMLYDLLTFHFVQDGHVYSRGSLLCLAPIFGAVNAVAVTRGLGTLPWGTTGHVVTSAFMLADFCSCRWEALDFAVGLKALVMISSMILGAISGCWFAMSVPNKVVLEYTIVGFGFALVVYINDDVFAQHEVSRVESTPDTELETNGSDDEASGFVQISDD